MSKIKLRVLWFSNTPTWLPAEFKLELYRVGWVYSLERTLADSTELELAVAFHYPNKSFKKIKRNSTTYYYVPEYKNLFNKIYRKLSFNDSDRNHFVYYQKIIDDFNPDIIQIFGTEKAFGLIVKNIEVPVVVHIQGNVNSCTYKWFDGIHSNYYHLKSLKLRNIIKLKNNAIKYLTYKKKSKREVEIFQTVQNFMGRTTWDKRLVKVLSPDAHYFQCEEVLREQFYTCQWEKPKNDDRIQLVSILDENVFKGIETLIYTTQILNNFKNLKIIWKVVGVQKNSEIVKAAQLSKKIALSDNIEFLGSLNVENMIAIMKESHIYVHTSHIENSSNSICEAMMLGMPIIATFAGGTSSLLKNDEEGILLQDGDPYSLAGAIMEMLENYDKAQTFGINARRRALARQNPQKIRNELLSIYKLILANDS